MGWHWAGAHGGGANDGGEPGGWANGEDGTWWRGT
jgi:hypothetical protein